MVKSNWWGRVFYPSFVWSVKEEEKSIYLTFDDGPHETATPFVLDTLKQYNAKATFFCIGKNVVECRDVYERVLYEGHTVGNHTYNHLKGWKTKNDLYINDVKEAAAVIDSNLFRPPYGRVKRFQAHLLQSSYKIIMWSVLSGDFDIELSPQSCWENVLFNTKAGDIVVFHDSAKAFERLKYALPKVLEHFSKEGYAFKAILQS